MNVFMAILTGIVCIIVAVISYRAERRHARIEAQVVVHGDLSGYKYYDLPWAKSFRRSCGARFSIYVYFGKCELQRNHRGTPHAAERGMEWVRFDNKGTTWITFAGDQNQSPPEIIIRKE